MKIPENLDEWVEKQLQDPEVLQRELLKLQEENETLKKRIKSLVDKLNGVIPLNSITKPLQPYIKDSMPRIPVAILEHYKDYWLFDTETKLFSLFKFGEQRFRVTYKRNGLFPKAESKEFTDYRAAFKYFSKVTS